ncbi:MAG: DNA polymerase III subunit delta [Clostridiales bacterium]|nr:DNA polymerase III subunit delta [Clostridiales bacterium]
MKNSPDHAYIRIEKDIKGDRIPSVVMLMGREDYLVNFYCSRLIDVYVEDAVKSLDLVTLHRDEVDLAGIIDNMETVSLMSRRKVVCLPDFYDSRGKLPEYFARHRGADEELAEYMKRVPEGSLLIITAGEPKDYRARQALRKSHVCRGAAAAGKVYDFKSLDRPQLNGFIEKRLNRSGKIYRRGIPSLIGDVCQYSNEKTGYGLSELENDIRKLIAYVGEAEEITADDVRAVITSNPENNVFAMVEAACRNRKDEAFRLLHNLLEAGVSEMMVLSMLTGQLELMLMSSELKEKGMGQDEAAGAVSKTRKGAVKGFQIRKALEAAGRTSSGNLKKMLAEAYETEHRIKDGLMPADLALEYFIGRI